MIKVLKLKKNFGSHLLFSNLNFVLPDYGLVLITGDNGSGKTTLLMILARLEKPTFGQVFYDDVDIGDSSSKARDKRKKEAIYLAPSGNFQEGVRIQDDLQRFDVDDPTHCPFANRLPQDLSGGEKEMVVGYLVHQTRKKIVFLDEGLAFLDANNGQHVLESINEARENHLIVLASPRKIPLSEGFKKPDVVITLGGDACSLK